MNKCRQFPRVYFVDRHEADEVLSCMDEIANTYARVSIADFLDRVGAQSRWIDTNYIITQHELETARVRKIPGYRDIRCRYYIDFPIAHHESFYEKSENDVSSQPIYITIHTKDISNLSEVLSETFKQASEIENRVVNITVM